MTIDLARDMQGQEDGKRVGGGGAAGRGMESVNGISRPVNRTGLSQDEQTRVTSQGTFQNSMSQTALKSDLQAQWYVMETCIKKEEREGGRWAIGLPRKREGERGGWWRLWERGRVESGQ